MIIKITQTASNVRQTYDITSDAFYFTGEAGSFSRLQNITISNADTTIKGVYKVAKWVNYIPFRYFFGWENRTKIFSLYQNGERCGSLYFSKHGFLKSCYVMTLDDGKTFHCYSISKGSFDYVCIFDGEQQIALLETYLSVNDYKYTHKLYLLESHDPYGELLSFFAVYYASDQFAQRMHMSKGSVAEKSWSFSRYNHKYDASFRETHFPDENFFGKTHLFDGG